MYIKIPYYNLSGKRLSGKVIVRERSCPGNVCKPNCVRDRPLRGVYIWNFVNFLVLQQLPNQWGEICRRVLTPHGKFHPYSCNVTLLCGEKSPNSPLTKLNTARPDVGSVALSCSSTVCENCYSVHVSIAALNKNNNRFMALCPGLPRWAGTRKNPTHHPDHHPVFISFFHLPRSIAPCSNLHNLSPCPLWSTSWSGALD